MSKLDEQKSYREDYIKKLFMNHELDKYEAELEEYLLMYPYSDYYKLLYSEALLSRKKDVEASIVLSEIDFKPDTHPSLMLKYYKAIVNAAIGMGYYKLALDVLEKNKDLFNAYKYQTGNTKTARYQYEEAVMFVKQKLGEEVNYTEGSSYDLKQLYDYSYENFILNVIGLDNIRRKMLANNEITKETDTAIFNTEVITIAKLAKRIRKIMKSNDIGDYAYTTGTIFDEYYFEYPGVASFNGKDIDYVKALTIRDTYKLTSIQPAPYKGTHKSIKLIQK